MTDPEEHFDYDPPVTEIGRDRFYINFTPALVWALRKIREYFRW